jgi:hypothetical protein
VACVKDLVLENWRRGYFDDGHNTMALQIMVPNEDIVQQTGGSSSSMQNEG